MVELYARNNIPDLSRYAISRAGNGAVTFDAITADFILPAIALNAGDFYYAVGNSFADQTVTFDTVFPAYSGIRVRNYGVNSNGDDVTGIFHDPTGAFAGGETLIDVFGEVGVDGTGTAWEHLDGYAYSKNGRSPSSTFNVLEWDVFNQALDTLDAAGHAAAFPDQTYSPSVASSPPTISAIPDQDIATSTTTGPLAFTVDDFQTAASNLVVTVTSDNPTLVPNNPANLVLGGDGANRTLEVIPATAEQGSANIEMVVTDADLDTATNTFRVIVGAPVISPVANQTTPLNTATGPIAFTVDDAETPGGLTVTGASSDPTLVQDGNIVVSAGGTNRTVTITPQAGQVGTVQITLTVDDGFNTVSTSFQLTVYPSIGIDLADDFNYADGDIEVESGFFWSVHSPTASTNADARVVSNKLQLSFTNANDIHAFLTNAPYATNSGIIVYAGMVVNFSELPSANGSYFAHFYPLTGFNYRARVFAGTSGAAAGKFRIGIANGSATVSEVFPQDLQLGADYNVVVGHNIGTAESWVWVNPVDQNSPRAAATDPLFPSEQGGFAFRQAGGIGSLTVDNLRVSTAFSDVLTAVTPVPVPLTITRDGGNVILEWTDPQFSLAVGASVVSATNKIGGATSPHTNAIVWPQEYFQLVWP